MRLLPPLLAVCALAAFAASAFAQDMDDDAAPAPPPSSDTATFVAFGQPVIAFTHAEIIDGTGAAPRYGQTLVIK
ncbi:MAG TPA: hypothetical protein VG387_21950, partial [Rhizomicrobium sp.]|nr:hypothetical protein [Rhizomicrobium sp.]